MTVMKRSEVEEWGYEILGSIPPWLEHDECELVTVDPESVPDERRSN